MKTSKRADDVYFTIVESISKNNSLPKGVLSKQSLNRYVKVLKTNGVISKIGYATWEFHKEKWGFFRQKQVNQKTQKKPQVSQPDPFKKGHFRGHGFVWTLRIKSPEKWYARKEFLEKKGVKAKNIRVGSTVGVSFLFKGHKTWLLDDSVVFYVPEGRDWWSTSASEAYELALFAILEVVRGLEVFLNVKFGRAGCYGLKCSRQHYADVGNAYARIRVLEKKPLNVSDHDGKWLLVDCSTGVPELETVHPKTAKGDMDDIISPFFNELKETKLMPSQVLEMISGVTKNQEFFAENMKSHVEAVKSLSRGVDELRLVVKELAQKPVKRKGRLVGEARKARAVRLLKRWGW